MQFDAEIARRSTKWGRPTLPMPEIYFRAVRDLHDIVLKPIVSSRQSYYFYREWSSIMTVRSRNIAIQRLLNDPRIRTVQIHNQTHFSAVDLVAVLTDSANPRADWDEIKAVEPPLRSRCVQAELGGETQDVLNLTNVMRLIQAIDSTRAEQLRNWIAKAAARRVQEESDPELAIQRTRQTYSAQGRTRRWIDQRLRSISARQEVVGEWYNRGVKDPEQFRLLTNRVLEPVFGMNVSALRESKGYARDLRDHLTDLELSLLSLAETTAACLHRHRQSNGIKELLCDIQDAGSIVSQTRHQIVQATLAGQPTQHHEVAA